MMFRLGCQLGYPILTFSYSEQINVLEPLLLKEFGGCSSFAGQITTIKCSEDNGLIREVLEQDGLGRILVVDGGGSLKRALVDAELASIAEEGSDAQVMVITEERDYSV
ncbi:hypothetical protein [[Leptolyngbya] sp. PCC 7376]|uniref:RraA family protein n=1 Tax=[Leptolyngbya] sp. PCC 7376 TaxID=111781 RepID=UPI0021F822A9|nr:hypothetical protein [[Leptolyngbya] sp. PCC 7376]